MTAVAQRTEEIGRRAVELMEKRLQQIDSDSKYMHDYIHSVIDVELIKRQSVASPTAT
jgi:DNA-binding LacI/PurR family transcriptional regulator